MDQIETTLREHRPVGTAGVGIEEVLCSCDFRRWMPARAFPAHQAEAVRAALGAQPHDLGCE